MVGKQLISEISLQSLVGIPHRMIPTRVVYHIPEGHVWSENSSFCLACGCHKWRPAPTLGSRIAGPDDEEDEHA
jgi:hypothetical protein